MDVRYRYGHRPGRRRRTRVAIVLAVSLVIVGGVASLILLDLRNHQSHPVQGQSHTVVQALDTDTDHLQINEPQFSMELPSDWKEIGRQNDSSEHSITWQATKKDFANRKLKLYIDTIPGTRSVNMLLPVTVQGNGLQVTDDLSDNCALFTPGGTLNAGQAQKLGDKASKYKGVDFICDLARITNQEVGTGEAGAPVNTITVKGTKGTHSYFFLYTDGNIQPDYTILTNAINSFKAK